MQGLKFSLTLDQLTKLKGLQLVIEYLEASYPMKKVKRKTNTKHKVITIKLFMDLHLRVSLRTK